MGFSIGTSKNSPEPALYINMVQQAGWNDSSKTGSFKENAKNPQKSGNIKFNANEAGEMLSSLKTRIPVVFFHKNGEDSTIIKFTPWDKNRVVKEQGGDKTYVSPAFGLSVSRNSTQNFKVALEAGETEVLALLLTDFIQQSLFAAAEKGRQDFVESQNKEQEKPTNTPRQESPAPAPDEEFDDVPF